MLLVMKLCLFNFSTIEMSGGLATVLVFFPHIHETRVICLLDNQMWWKCIFLTLGVDIWIPR